MTPKSNVSPNIFEIINGDALFSSKYKCIFLKKPHLLIFIISLTLYQHSFILLSHFIFLLKCKYIIWDSEHIKSIADIRDVFQLAP